MWLRRFRGGSEATGDTGDTQSVHPDSNSDTYTALNMKTRSPEYDTLAGVEMESIRLVIRYPDRWMQRTPPSPQRTNPIGLNTSSASQYTSTGDSGSEWLECDLHPSEYLCLEGVNSGAVLLLHISQCVHPDPNSGLVYTALGPDYDTLAVMVLGEDGWSVTYTTQSICALKGSTVELSCSYTYPSVSSEDAGRYSCAVEGHEVLHSPEETLTVRYGPKNTSVSVSPSGEIVEGSSVTLTCSSDANPPVDKYTWYKKNVTSPKASGQSYSITNISSEDSGEYYCEAENEIASSNSIALMIIVAGDSEEEVKPQETQETHRVSILTLTGTCTQLLNMKTRSPEYDTLAWYWVSMAGV
ncbi:hypothetical protein J4Q44_G00289780 [Coregonus suidteri]|uniref:Ig-like domain-containing protein n=1 Tax=Coregonus suidteri TaxID=861788 RepID=A0AAN8L8K6_9TELE